MPPIKSQDFELTEYESVWALQRPWCSNAWQGEIPDTILLGEHPAVITLGRGTNRANLLDSRIPTIEIERGGDVTYHGPGQLVAYPIFLLPEGQRDLHRFLRNLEEVVILTLADFGIQGERNPGWTGVWAKQPQTGTLLKLASLGVAVKKWVTYHGLALNVATDLSAFSAMNPCGLTSETMTSMQALLNQPITVETVKPRLVEAFQHVFQ